MTSYEWVPISIHPRLKRENCVYGLERKCFVFTEKKSSKTDEKASGNDL